MLRQKPCRRILYGLNQLPQDWVLAVWGCEKSPLKVKRTLSGMKPGGVLFFVVKLSYYE